MLQKLLHITNLTVGYRNGAEEKMLFENLTLELRAGELVCFMGSNGVGKSTLIKTLAGLIPALSTKRISINPKNISVVLTDRISALNMSVRELIAYGRYPYLSWHARHNEEDEKIINNAIANVHLTDLADRSINELSDGQLQMVMIARALVQDTPIILLDEPTAHLDLNNRVAVMNVLRKLSREMNKAILVSTHELDLALQTADLLWLADGSSILSGVPEDLVLDGSLDRVFQFKGFDLKTGKVFHEAHRGVEVWLKGGGHRYLWTKNALERCGYNVSDLKGVELEILVSGGWRLAGKDFEDLKSLLNQLSTFVS